MMQQLNLPSCQPRTRANHAGKAEIFDPFRRKFVRLTPEEWVRQHFLSYLTVYKGYPASLIAVESALTYNRQAKRSDILVYGNGGKPLLVVECKAPEVALEQTVFDQVAMYNKSLMVPYLIVTNGMSHFACKIDHANNSYTFLKDIPDYETIIN